MPIDVDALYKKWVTRIGENRINLKYPSLRGLYDWFLRETERRAIDPEGIDFEALVDPTLTYKENKQILEEEMKAPLTETDYERMFEEQKGLLEKEAEEQYPEIIGPLRERIFELEREADKKKRYQRLVKELRLELAETIKKLEQERAKPPEVKPVSIRVVKDFREGIIDYKAGQIVETRDLDWVLQKIQEGKVERLKPPEVPPPKEEELPPAKFKVGDLVKVEMWTQPGEIVKVRLVEPAFRKVLKSPWEYEVRNVETNVQSTFNETQLSLIPPEEVYPPAEKEAKVKIKVEGATDKGEYLAHMLFDSFEAGFIGFRTTETLENWLKTGEEEVDWGENLRMAGFSPEEIQEELKTYPEPFKEGVPVRVLWKYPEDVSFDDVAKRYWDIAHTSYYVYQLGAMTVAELKEIAQIKHLRTPPTKEELINVIMGVPPPAPPAPPVMPPIPRRPPALPPPKKELTSTERRRLEDEFRVTLVRELGRIPRDSMAEFRLELETVKVGPYERAREHLLKVAQDIINREYAKEVIKPAPPPERIIRVGVPPEERPPMALPPEFVVYPTELPKLPLNPAPFPRAPTSEERAVIWDWFRYEMSRLGIDPHRFRAVLENRLNIPYRTWEGFIKTLQEMMLDIEAGRELALIPLLRIPMPWEEAKGTEKWRRDAIVHFAATKLYVTMDELIEKLSEWGVFPAVSPEEVKTAVKEAWKTKDIWFTSVPKDFLDTLLGEDVGA